MIKRTLAGDALAKAFVSWLPAPANRLGSEDAICLDFWANSLSKVGSILATAAFLNFEKSVSLHPLFRRSP